MTATEGYDLAQALEFIADVSTYPAHDAKAFGSAAVADHLCKMLDEERTGDGETSFAMGVIIAFSLAYGLTPEELIAIAADGTARLVDELTR